MSVDGERAILRKGTVDFINADPTELVLIPTVEELRPNGGTARVDGDAREPQTFKLIPMTFDQRPAITAGGVERIIDHTLLGAWDSTIEVWDHWQDEDNNLFTVVAIANGNGYSRKGLVEKHLPRD